MSNSLIKNLDLINETIPKIFEDDNLTLQYANIVEKSISSLKLGGSIFIGGNGGSASQADHFVGELVGRFYKEGKSLKVFSLNSNQVVLTAISNDFSYDDIFYQQLNGQMNKKDLFIGISTSGTSKNIIKAVDFCKENDFEYFLLTGESNLNEDISNNAFIVPSTNTPTIQEVHIIFLHSLAEDIEKSLRIT